MLHCFLFISTIHLTLLWFCRFLALDLPKMFCMQIIILVRLIVLRILPNFSWKLLIRVSWRTEPSVVLVFCWTERVCRTCGKWFIWILKNTHNKRELCSPYRKQIVSKCISKESCLLMHSKLNSRPLKNSDNAEKRFF